MVSPTRPASTRNQGELQIPASTAFPLAQEVSRGMRGCHRSRSMDHLPFDDRLTPLYFSQELAVKIPAAKLLVADKGGHAHSQTMPEEFNRVVIDYIMQQQRQFASG